MKNLKFMIFFLGSTLIASDYDDKMSLAVDLVGQAKKIFLDNNVSLVEACAELTNNKKWRPEDLRPIVWSSDGTRLVALDADLIWTKFEKKPEVFGRYLMNTILVTGQLGGWVTYPFLNSSRHVYVQSVIKDKKTYVIGEGFFSEHPAIVCKSLVASFLNNWGEFKEISELFQLASNRYGPYVIGNLSLKVIDIKGICWVNAENDLLIGKNLLSPDYKESEFYKKILDKAKEVPSGWFEETQNDIVIRRTYYFSAFVKNLKNKFVVMSSYSPLLNEEKVLQVAKNISEMLKKEGKKKFLSIVNKNIDAVKKITDDTVLGFLITDYSGVVLATSDIRDGSMLGQNLLDYVDQKKRKAMKFLNDEVHARGFSWVTRFNRNGLERLYAEKVNVEKENLIVIVLGYYPYEREEIAKVLVNDVVDHFKINGGQLKDLKLLQTFGSPFMKGDIQVSIYDELGICWVNGLREDDIWNKNGSIAAVFKDLANYDSFEYHDEKYVFQLEENLLPNIDGKWLVCARYT